MRYILTKFVDADNYEDAVRKAKRIPFHEVYIHTDSWKDSGYALNLKNEKIGFKDAEKKD